MSASHAKSLYSFKPLHIPVRAALGQVADEVTHMRVYVWGHWLVELSLSRQAANARDDLVPSSHDWVDGYISAIPSAQGYLCRHTRLPTETHLLTHLFGRLSRRERQLWRTATQSRERSTC
jgi:hypothetical protein